MIYCKYIYIFKKDLYEFSPLCNILHWKISDNKNQRTIFSKYDDEKKRCLK